MTRPRGAHPTSQTAEPGSVMGRTVSIMVRGWWPPLRPMGGCVLPCLRTFGFHLGIVSPQGGGTLPSSAATQETQRKLSYIY